MNEILTRRNRQGRTPIDRLLDLIVIDENGCWIFQGAKVRGYGRFAIGTKTRGDRVLTSPHRVAYMYFVGPIPDGLELDHLCRVPACCNPDHLEPVTSSENVRRGTSLPAVNARKTHCKRGHPFDEANTMIDCNGSRQCRVCRNLRQRMNRARGGRSDRRA